MKQPIRLRTSRNPKACQTAIERGPTHAQQSSGRRAIASRLLQGGEQTWFFIERCVFKTRLEGGCLMQLPEGGRRLELRHLGNGSQRIQWHYGALEHYLARRNQANSASPHD